MPDLPEEAVQAAPAELIEAALHEHFPLRLTRSAIEDAQRGWPVRLSGAQRQDVARIAVDALAGAGLVVVSAEDLRVYVTEEMPDFATYVTAQARLRAALPERTPDA